MTDTLLKLSGVHTHIGEYHILQGVDLAVPRGGLTVLLGRNGAGKTTTLRTIMGLWRASAGRVEFNGRDIGQLHTPDIAQAGIAYVPESMAVFGALTVRENLYLAARSGPMDGARLEWIFSFFPALIGYLVLKDRGPFVRAHTATALNFQITIFIAYVVGGILSIVVIGIFIILAAWVLNIVFSIIAAVKANQGEYYTYPVAIRFVS